MKKSKKIGLSLNKKVISNLKQGSIQGGASRGYGYCSQGCQPNTEFIDCGSQANCGSRATCNQN